MRASKFRHVFGQAAKKTECYDSLRITKNSLENYYIAINAKYIALCIDAGGGGAFVVIPHEKVSVELAVCYIHTFLITGLVRSTIGVHVVSFLESRLILTIRHFYGLSYAYRFYFSLYMLFH